MTRTSKKMAEKKICQIQDINSQVHDIALKIGCSYSSNLPTSIERVLERNAELLTRLRAVYNR